MTRAVAQEGDDRAPNGQETRPLVYDRVSYAYRGGDTIVRDVSLALEEGKVVLVTGPSGAGKTTICRAANGLIPHEFKGRLEGSVTIAGRYDSRDMGVSSLSKVVGVLSQDPETQLFNPTVEDEIVFGACNYGLPVDTIRDRTERLLGLTRLGPHRRKNPHNLSGGQQQACALASILAFEPLVLVLDEPTSNIDPIGSQQVLDLVAQLAREENRTTLLVEHKIEELADLVDEMIVIDKGEILHRGTVREVLEHVEYIDSVGLSVPQVTLLSARLRTAGWSIEELPIGVEEAAGVLSPLIDRETLNRAPEPPPRRAQHESEEVVVSIAGLSHVYQDGTRALRDVDLEISRGEFVGILGQNGSGKTTLVKHFNGLLKPTEGSVRVGGEETVEQGIRRLGQWVGYVFQNPDHQIFSDTVFDEVAFGPRIREMEEDEVEERVLEALAAVGMEGRGYEDPFGLAKGERQRVAVASVLAVRPEVMILDEPTTGLDYAEQRSMMDLVQRLNEANSTIIVVTHTMWVVAEYAHRAMVVRDGKVSLSGTVREVFAQEEELRDAFLRPPHIVSLGNSLGFPILSVEEMLRVTEDG